MSDYPITNFQIAFIYLFHQAFIQFDLVAKVCGLYAEWCISLSQVVFAKPCFMSALQLSFTAVAVDSVHIARVSCPHFPGIWSGSVSEHFCGNLYCGGVFGDGFWLDLGNMRPVHGQTDGQHLKALSLLTDAVMIVNPKENFLKPS